ncbi:hypothetical protein J3U08_11150 [Gilliamella sp. B2894]|uniref:TraK family protein n=1 Tax=Gilliamella sp. B2894 TaxID=2817978 RepID=UPI00226AED7E|nr:TraK family protein [Gilliamella sp. B2894]MCX8657347.1 hypothetical protein [Gilliamella sp. B2894]
MAKTLSKRIAERMNNKKTKKAKNRADFLTHKEEIKEAINDGWSVKIIWETLTEEKRISLSYPAFNNYVNKSLKESKNTNINNKAKTIKSQGFNFNSNPDLKDLV